MQGSWRTWSTDWARGWRAENNNGLQGQAGRTRQARWRSPRSRGARGFFAWAPVSLKTRRGWNGGWRLRVSSDPINTHAGSCTCACLCGQTVQKPDGPAASERPKDHRRGTRTAGRTDRAQWLRAAAAGADRAAGWGLCVGHKGVWGLPCRILSRRRTACTAPRRARAPEAAARAVGGRGDRVAVTSRCRRHAQGCGFAVPRVRVLAAPSNRHSNRSMRSYF